MKIGILLLAIGNILAWFHFNSQFVWDWLKDKPIFSSFVFAIPVGICFWYATKHIFTETGELWSTKLVGFGVSNTVFAIMTYVLMKESIFTAKTMTCLFFASLIIAIQLFWK